MRSIGELRHKVKIQEKFITSVGNAGNSVFSWRNTCGDVPACITTLNGREAEQARMLVAQATVKITFRYREGITSKNRIVKGSRVFNIGHLDNIDQRNLWLVATCTEET
jgi:SPP1 family predicted phage head-tail adaptor